MEKVLAQYEVKSGFMLKLKYMTSKKRRHAKLREISQHYDLVKLIEKNCNIYLTFDKEVNNYLLKEGVWIFHKPVKGWDLLISYIGKDSVIQTNDKRNWNHHRKSLLTFFKSDKLNSYVDIFHKTNREYFKLLDQHALDGSSVNLKSIVAEYTLVNAARSFIAGIDFNVSEILTLLQQANKDLSYSLNIINRRIAKIFPFYLKNTYSRGHRFRSIIEKAVDEYIDKDLRLNNLVDKIAETKSDGADLKTYLYDEVSSMLIAGHFTTGSAISSALVYISRYKEYAKRIRDEYNSINSKEGVSLSHIREMRFTTAFFQEVLRLHPPVAGITRIASEKNSFKNITFEKDDIVLIPSHEVNRHPDHWKNPDEFNPERFLGDNLKNIDPHYYLPFSWGSRSCIGRQFSIIEACVFLGEFCQKYHFDLASNCKYEDVYYFTAWPKEVIGRLHRIGT